MNVARTLVVTDVVDSVLVSARLGDELASKWWSAHHRLARDLLRRWRGREIDSSDGFLLMFDGVGDALQFSFEYHRAIADLQPPIQARVGVHVALFVVRENSAEDIARGAKTLEVDGVAKMIAARTMAVARGKQTLLTKEAHAKMPPGPVRVESHGHWRIKGIDEPIELFAASDDTVAIEPPPETEKAYRVVRNDDIWVPLREVRHSLLPERDSFVGRQSALHALRRSFEAGSRLVSLLGVGGVGKTRLAQRFGWSCLGDFPGGVWFADLSQARTLDGICFALAQSLDTIPGPSDVVAQLGNVLASRGRCLVVLDNFEQVVEYAPDTVVPWLDTALQAHFLVTSRENLDVPGEMVMRLGTLEHHDAEELFTRRAESSGRRRPTPDDAAVTSSLVELLDRLPLAIELAAARAASVPLRTLLRRMNERFDLLVSKGNRRTRQATLRAAFDWSWELLSPAEKAAFAQLSVVEGSCTLDAAEAIVDVGGASPPASSIDVLESLVHKSLVRQRPDDRYDMLTSVRAYAAEKLGLAHEEVADSRAGDAGRRARSRHCAWYASLDEAQAGVGRGAELDNFVAACRFAVGEADAELAVRALEAAWVVLHRRGPFRVALELVNAVGSLARLEAAAQARVELIGALALGASGNVVAAEAEFVRTLATARASGALRVERRALAQLGDLQLVAGRIERARKTLFEALSLARSGADLEVECIALGHLGNLADNVGNTSEATDFYQQALAVARRAGDRRREGGALGNLGLVLHNQGKTNEARLRYTEALALARDVGDRQWEGNTLCNLGLLLHEQGAFADAFEALQSAMSVAEEMGYARLGAVVRCNLGLVLEALEQREEATAHFEMAVAAAHALGDRRSEGQFLGYLGLARARQGRFGEAVESLGTGNRLLAAVEDRVNQAALLCQWVQAECLAGNAIEAAARLAQAEALTRGSELGESSELAALLRDAASMLDGLKGASLNRPSC